MTKENKAKEELKENKCDCGPDCKCGCQEGKECTCNGKCDCGSDCKCGCHCGCNGNCGSGCGCHGGCGCGCNGNCGCGCGCKRVLGKVICLALVFFAGMGVNQFMNDTCFGRCPAKRGMRPMPMMQMPRTGNLPAYTDAAGNTVVIVNTGDENSKHCGKKGKFGKHHHQMPNPIPQENSQPAE